MGVPVYVICPFSLVAFSILSLSLIVVIFDYCVSLCVPPAACPAGNALLPGLGLVLLPHVGEVFSCYFFRYFLRSFLCFFSLQDPYNANVSAFNVVSEVS